MKTNTFFHVKGILFLLLTAIFSNIANAQSYKWARQGSSEGFEYGNAMIADDSGNVYVTGQLEFTTTFDNGIHLNSNGKHDILLGKYGSDGSLKWVHHAGGVSGDVGWGIGLDRTGNVYHIGEFEYTCGFEAGDSITVYGSNDIYLSKYSNDGHFIWAENFGGSSDDKGKAIAVDANGNSYITGYFSSTGHFGSTNLNSNSNSNDVFIAKVNSAGTVLWAKKGGGSKEDRGRGIVLDGQGNVYITGTITQSATFNTTTINVQGTNSLFVAKYDTNGVFKWVRGSGACCDTTRGNAITVDNSGNVYVAGYFKDNTTIGGNSFTSLGSADIIVAKYDPSGNVQWVKQAGGPYEDMAYACVFDRNKNQLYVTGQIDDHGNFGSIYFGSAGNRDVFVAGYDESGNELFARPAGSNQRDVGQAITYDTLGNIYVSGFFNDTANFGSSQVQGYPLADFFVAKMAPALATQPTTNASSLTAALANCNNVQLNFASGNGTRRIVVAKAGSTVNGLPVDANYYTASSVFGQGSDLGSGSFVVYDGTGISAVVSGINSGTTYYFAVFEYNGVGYASNYILPNFPTTSFVSNGFSVTASSAIPSICTGGSTTLCASTATTYSWSPSNGLSSTNDSVVTASPASTTTYTVTATNGGGCTATSTITVSVSAPPTVTFTAPAAICENSSPVSLTGGSPAGGTYSGSGISGNSYDPTVNGVGTFNLTYSYTDANSCAGSANASITVNARPNVTIGTLGNVCASATNIQLTSGSPSGGTYSGNGVTGTRFNASVAGPGNQTITYSYTASNGCSNTASTTVLVNANPNVTLNAFTPACVNASPITLSGGSPAGGTFTGTQVSAGVFNPQTAGVGNFLITYSYTDGNGCLASASSSMTVTALPSVTIVPMAAICQNASAITLNGGSPAGGSYSGTGVTNGNFDPIVAGTGTKTITYTYSDQNGCTNSASTSITVNAAPSVTLATFNPACQNQTLVTLSGGSPAGGTFSGNGVSGSTFNPSQAGAGTTMINYSVTNGSGCTASASAGILVNPTPSVSYTAPTMICVNATPSTLTGGTPAGGTYSGSGVSAGTFNPTTAGTGMKTITYSYTDANGCSATASSTITVNSLPVVTIGNISAICTGSSPVTLTAGNPAGGTYSGNGITNNSFNPALVGVGTYPVTYTYTDGNGCSASTNGSVTVNTGSNVLLSAFNPVCSNTPAFALSGGSPAGGSYSGSGVNGIMFNPATAGAGNIPITYSYTSGNGCVSTAQSTIVVNAAPVVTQSTLNATCSNTASFQLTGGSPAGGTYSGTGVSANSFDPSVAGVGTTTITYIYTTAQGCTNSANTTQTVNAAPVVSLSAFSPICSNAGTMALTGGSPAGGTFAGSGVTGTNFDPAVPGAGTTTITYSVTNGGCSASASSAITVNAAPTVTLSAITPLCTNSGSQTLTNGSPAGGAYSGTGIAGNIFTPTNTGTYTETYTYTNASGCTASAQTNIVVNAIPVVTLGNFASICVNASPITLTGGQPAGGVYGGVGVNNGSFDPSVGSGLHVISYTYTNANNCSATTTSNVIVNPAPSVNLGRDTMICAGSAMTLAVGNGFTSVQWSTGQTSNSITVDSTGIGFNTASVVVTVSNNAGCVAKDTVAITFDNCNGVSAHEPMIGVYMYPNPFDGSFHILCERPLDYSIYDVSGRLVDGGKNVVGNVQAGEQLAPGTYFITFTNKEVRKTFQLVKAF
jgi:hypothetical protein